METVQLRTASAFLQGGDIMLFGRKKKPEITKTEFNPEKQKAVIHCSICTGEQVAGFKDNATGHFEEIMLIRGEEDLKVFKEKYGVTDITKEY